jgi:two-component system OmpR family sensor kinase
VTIPPPEPPVRRRPVPRRQALRGALARASLRVRVMAAAAVLVAVTSVLMGLLGTVLLRGYLVGRVDAQLRTFSSFISRVASRPPSPPRRGPSQLPTDFLVEVIDADGQVHVVPESRHGIAPPVVPAARLHGPDTPVHRARRRRLRALVAGGGPGGAWRPAGGHRGQPGQRAEHRRPAGNRRRGGGRRRHRVAGVHRVPAGAGQPGPAVADRGHPQAIAAGELSRRIASPPERTEVGRLAAALNAMLGRIEAAYRAREDGESRARDSEDRMRRFVADASHELRTPLTSVKGLAEFYFQQGEAASRAEVTRLMTGIQQEAARMGRLVEDLLLLAHFDEDRPLDLAPVDLSSVAAQAAGAARARQPERPLTVAAAEPAIVSADAGRLRQVIDNLLGNALQHTPPGTLAGTRADAHSRHARHPGGPPGPAGRAKARRLPRSV